MPLDTKQGGKYVTYLPWMSELPLQMSTMERLTDHGDTGPKMYIYITAPVT